MVNWFLSCHAPDVIYVQLPHDRAVPVTNISCQTNATDPEMYTVLDASGTDHLASFRFEHVLETDK